MTKRVWIYGRVSTDEQAADNKTSLDMQEERCRDYARQRGWEVVGAVREDYTGYELNRPELDDCRRRMQRGEFDILLCTKVDRLTRNHLNGNVILLEARQYNVLLDFTDDQIDLNHEADPLMLQFYLYFAERERNVIRSRLMDGKAGLLSRKQPILNGPAPYGYLRVKSDTFRGFAKDPNTESIVARIWDEVIGGAPFTEVARNLNHDSINTLTGRGNWHNNSISRLCKNPAYKGWTVAHRKNAAGTSTLPESEWLVIDSAGVLTPAYVTETEWSAVNSRLKSNASDRTRNKSQFHLLRGLAFCQRCGSRLYSVRDTKNDYYVCGRRWQAYQRKSNGADVPTCDAPYVRSDVLEHAVWSEVLTLLFKRDTEVRTYLESDAVRGPDVLLNSERQQIVRQSTLNEKRRDQILKRMAEEEDDDLYADLKAQWGQQREEAEVLQNRLALIDGQLLKQAESISRVDRFVELLSKISIAVIDEELTDEDRLQALHALGLRVDVTDAQTFDLKIYDRDANSLTPDVQQVYRAGP